MHTHKQTNLCIIFRYRIVSTEKSTIGQGIHLEDHNLLQKDVVLLEEELDNAKDTLAEVQALLLEMKSKQNSLVTTKRNSSARKSSGNGLTSEQWIKVYRYKFSAYFALVLHVRMYVFVCVCTYVFYTNVSTYVCAVTDSWLNFKKAFVH